MKVIKAKSWMIYECGGCKSKLEADIGDVWCSAGTDISGTYDEDYYITCPVCGTNRHLSYKEVPPKAKKDHY